MGPRTDILFLGLQRAKWEVRFEFPTKVIGKSAMAFLKVQSWCVPKFCYTGDALRAKKNGFDSVRLRRLLHSLHLASLLRTKNYHIKLQGMWNTYNKGPIATVKQPSKTRERR